MTRLEGFNHRDTEGTELSVLCVSVVQKLSEAETQSGRRLELRIGDV